jgi:signal transduction histidine kinase
MTAKLQAHARVPMRWHQSLYFRIMLLCGILLLCLLGSVVVITRYYFGEVVQQMEAEAQQIAEQIVIHFEEHPEIEAAGFEMELPEIGGAFDTIRIEPNQSNFDQNLISAERGSGGEMVWVARVPLQLGERHVQMIASVTIVPQTEILRAFKNTYLLALFGLFVITLGAMIYVIARTLRPLKQLSDSCTAISEGQLQTVSTRGAAGEVLALERTFNNMVDSLQEKEAMEAKLRQAQRLSALGNLAAGVAHDVRNPLNAIKLLSSHAMDQLQDHPSARQLATIRDEVGRLEEIVTNFLSLAKDQELRPEPQRIDALLEECCNLVQKDAEARQVRLSTELRCGDTTLMLDHKAFIRAILNVLINGLEACPPKGRVRLFSRRSDTVCEVEVRDDGPGLTREEQDRVFEPYYTTKPTGTGLGLSITRGIIEEHGGRIEMSCTPGHGCQVLITLPLNRTEAA